jgi:hypothetical protein
MVTNTLNSGEAALRRIRAGWPIGSTIGEKH